jgi:hypothetical protein
MATSNFQQFLSNVAPPFPDRNAPLGRCRFDGQSVTCRLLQGLKPRLRMKGRAAENVLTTDRSFG